MRLLVDRDHRDRRCGGIATRAEHLPAQRREDVDRPATHQAERRQRGRKATEQRDQENRDGVPPDDAHGRVPARYCSDTRRPITGPVPDAASASTTKAVCLDFSVIA